MKYFIDTEFSENGGRQPITLISVGIVAEDGREFYGVSSEFNPDYCSEWIQANVVPNLGFKRCLISHLKRLIEGFCDPEEYGPPEFWADYAAYDWVVFCQIFGTMVDLPEGFPMWCHDIQQLREIKGGVELPKQETTAHNALNDAHYNKLTYEFLMKAN